MDLNRTHAFEYLALMLVRVMSENQTVTNLKRVSLLFRLVVDKLSRRVRKLGFGDLWILEQQMIDVRRNAPNRHIREVNRDHVDEHRLGIALVVHAAILVFLTTELRFGEDRKMVHCDFRTKSRKLLNKRRHLFDQ